MPTARELRRRGIRSSGGAATFFLVFGRAAFFFAGASSTGAIAMLVSPNSPSEASIMLFRSILRRRSAS